MIKGTAGNLSATLNALIITVFVLGLFIPGQASRVVASSVLANTAQDVTPQQGGGIEISQGVPGPLGIGLQKNFTRIGQPLPEGKVHDTLPTALLLNIVPANDEITSPTEFTALPSDFSQDVTDATQSPDDPDLIGCNRQAGLASVWYKYTPSTSGLVVMDTFNSNYDTMIGIWSRLVDGMTEVTCNDDYQGTESLVAFQAVAGEEYFVGISQYNGGLSAFEGGSADFNEVSAEKIKSQESSPDTELLLEFHVDDSLALTPYLMVSFVRDTVTAYNLMPSDEITLSIGDYSETVSSTFGSVTLELHGLVDILPGDIVNLTDGYYPISHKVRYLSFTNVNIDANSVNGTADVGSDVFTYAYDSSSDSYEEAFILPDFKGTWGHVFSNVDFVPGTVGFVDQCDSGGNCTYDEWFIPDPHIYVDPQYDEVFGELWTAYAEVTLRIDGIPMGSRIADKNGSVLFDIRPAHIKPGQLIKMTDGTYNRKHEVVNLSVTAIDKVKDKLTGTSLPNTKLYMGAWPLSGYGYTKTILADASGNWKVNFSGLVDIDTGSTNDIWQCDAKGNCTEIWAYLFPKPAIYDPVLDTIKATLYWDIARGAMQYKVQVARDALFTNLVFNGKTSYYDTFAEISNLKSDKKYYWRVRALRELTPNGPWSNVGIFTMP